MSMYVCETGAAVMSVLISRATQRWLSELVRGTQPAVLSSSPAAGRSLLNHLAAIIQSIPPQSCLRVTCLLLLPSASHWSM